jgi:hypothetical protein
MTFTYFIDGQAVGSHTPARAEELKNARFMFALHTHASTVKSIVGYLDNARIGIFTP